MPRSAHTPDPRPNLSRRSTYVNIVPGLRQRRTSTRLRSPPPPYARYDPVRQAALETLTAAPRDEQLNVLRTDPAVSEPTSLVSDGDIAVSIALLSRASTPMRRPQTNERSSLSSNVAHDALPDIIQDLSNLNEEMTIAGPVASSSRLDDTQLVRVPDVPTRADSSTILPAPPGVAPDEAPPSGESSAVSRYLEFSRTSEDFEVIVATFGKACGCPYTYLID